MKCTATAVMKMLIHVEIPRLLGPGVRIEPRGLCVAETVEISTI